MRYTKQLIDRYKRFRNTSLLRHDYHAKYAFVGIGNHSMYNPQNEAFRLSITNRIIS